MNQSSSRLPPGLIFMLPRARRARRAPPAAREPATPKNYRHNFDSLPSPKAKHDNECWQ